MVDVEVGTNFKSLRCVLLIEDFEFVRCGNTVDVYCFEVAEEFAFVK